MTRREFTLTTRQVIPALIAVILLSSTATAIAVQRLSFNPIVSNTGPLQQAGDIVLEEYELVITGAKVDGVDVTLNNTGSTAHDVDVNVALRDSNEDLLVEKTKSDSVNGNTVKTTFVDFGASNEPQLNSVEDVEITIQVTD